MDELMRVEWLPYVLYLIIFLYGIVFGSFLNVCIYRIPEGEGIVKEGSHCKNCGHRLRWYDLFPLFSWLFLKGKCRYCGEKISAQYPVVEAANGILYVLIFFVNGWSVESFLWCIITSCLIVLSVIDFRTMMIPVGTYIIILAAGVVHFAVYFDRWIDYLIGFIGAGLFLLLCALVFRAVTGKAGLGLGDIELMACSGLSLGGSRVFFAIIIGCILGAVCEGVRMAVTKKRGKFAFGPYLSVGIFVCLLWGGYMYEWYLGLIGL